MSPCANVPEPAVQVKVFELLQLGFPAPRQEKPFDTEPSASTNRACPQEPSL